MQSFIFTQFLGKGHNTIACSLPCLFKSFIPESGIPIFWCHTVRHYKNSCNTYLSILGNRKKSWTFHFNCKSTLVSKKINFFRSLPIDCICCPDFFFDTTSLLLLDELSSYKDPIILTDFRPQSRNSTYVSFSIMTSGMSTPPELGQGRLFIVVISMKKNI